MSYVGFDDSDIRGTDRAISIHVLAEIRHIDRLPHFRLGQADIGGIDDGIAAHITDQNTHRNGNIARGRAIVHIMKGHSDSLSVGHASEIDGDLRCPAPAETAHHPGARRH